MRRLRFLLEERDRRWSAVRAAMDARGLDCLIIVGRGMNGNGDTRWLDGGDYGERSMVFPKRGAPVTFWLLQNWGKWYTESCFEGVRYRGHEGKVSIVATDAVKELGYERARIGIVGLIGGGYGAEGAIPYMTYQNLKRLLPDAEFADASDILTRLRMVKSAEEVAMMEKAAEMVNIEIDAVLGLLPPGRAGERDIRGAFRREPAGGGGARPRQLAHPLLGQGISGEQKAHGQDSAHGRHAVHRLLRALRGVLEPPAHLDVDWADG